MPERGKKRGLVEHPRILVLGDTGLFGKNLIPLLEEHYPKAEIIKPHGMKFFDLTRQNHAATLFKESSDKGIIDYVINLAAYSGGMFENMQRPASFWYQNLTIQMNVLEQCAIHKVKKLLVPIGGCSYPDILDPDEGGVLSEEDMWKGLPHENSRGYSAAKRQILVGAWAYHKQFGLHTVVVIPTNPIGPWSNVDQESAHVPMALLGRFMEAKREGYNSVTVYGSGRPVRDFLYIGDQVKLFPYFLNYYNGLGPVNISSGVGTSIRELAETIAKVVGYEGKIHYDRSKSDGQMKKVLANTRLLEFLNSIGVEWEPTPLEEALELTLEWYKRRVI